jgi:hypothetical protein
MTPGRPTLPQTVVHDRQQPTGLGVIRARVTDRVGSSCQESHDIVNADIASHRTGTLGADQELAQDVGERSDDRRLAQLQMDAVGGKCLDEVALACSFARQELDE